MKKIQDVGAIWSMLNSSKELVQQVYVWKFVGDKKHLGVVRIESVRKYRNDFCIVPIDGQEKNIASIIASQVEVDLYIPESAMLIRCKLRQADSSKRYYLNFPSQTAILERRNSLRLNVYESGSIKSIFSKSIVIPRLMTQFFEKTVTDIGSGGFSFFVSKIENKYFQIGDPIIGIAFKSFDLNIRVDGVVTSMREISPDEFNGLNYRVWRISCKFRDIDSSSKKQLERYIFERIKQDLDVING